MTLGTGFNFSPTTPAPPSGNVNNIPQTDSGAPTPNVSHYTPLMTGDSGTGGAAGSVPAPPAGSAAAGKFLKADGTFAVPAGGGGGTPFTEVVAFSGTSGTLSHTPIGGSLILFRNRLAQFGVGGSPDYSISGAAITLTLAAGGSDVFIAVYSY